MRDDMVAIPAGWFTAGCPRVVVTKEFEASRKAVQNPRWMEECVHQNPPRRVWVSAFEIDRLETTRAEYRLCVDAGACGSLDQDNPRLPRELPRELEPDLPVLVRWVDADAYCGWRGKRLPTEAEWERAARGDDERTFPWGDEPPTCDRGPFGGGDLTHQINVYCDRGEREGYIGDWLARVGTHPAGASPYGVLDMYGNASEWTSDWSNHARPLDLRPLAFEREEHSQYVVLVYDWRSVKFLWYNPAVVDPQGPPDPYFIEEEPDDPQRQTNRIAKGQPHRPSIGARRIGIDPEGFRCVRSVDGPSPPEVPAPRMGEYVYPFREPGAPTRVQAADAAGSSGPAAPGADD